MAAIDNNSSTSYIFDSPCFEYPYGIRQEEPHFPDPNYTLRTTLSQLTQRFEEYMVHVGRDREDTYEKEAEKFLKMLHPNLYQNFDESFNHQPWSKIIIETIYFGETKYYKTVENMFHDAIPKDDIFLPRMYYDYSMSLRGIPQPTYECNYEDPVTPILKMLNEKEEAEKHEKQRKMLNALKFWKH